MMEEKWLVYLRENNPELYQQAVDSVKWSAEWRDNALAAANAKIAELHDDEAMERMYQDGLHNGAIAANARVTELEAQLNETYTDEYGTVWTRPTAWAYAAVCKANDKNREDKEQAEAQCAAWKRADEIMNEIQKLRTAAQFEGYGAELDAEEKLPKLWEEYNKLTEPDAGTAILADNKRMWELLVEIKSYAESYVDLNPRLKHIIDCAKAALEGK